LLPFPTRCYNDDESPGDVRDVSGEIAPATIFS
jgi:hypothetical protein